MDAETVLDRYLTVKEAAEVLGTGERFPRRLIEENRIEFQKFGKHVRIGARVLAEYIRANTIPANHLGRAA